MASNFMFDSLMKVEFLWRKEWERNTNLQWENQGLNSEIWFANGHGAADI